MTTRRQTLALLGLTAAIYPHVTRAQATKIPHVGYLLIFGNPQGGTPFVECAQSMGIDLPLKALVWEDAQGQVWLSYNAPAFLAQRHGVAQCPAVSALSKALSGLAEATIGR